MIVLDSSAACDIARQTEEGLAFCSLMLADEQVISCDLLRAEAVSVSRKLCRRGVMNREEAQECFVDSVAYVYTYYAIQELQDEVLSERIR